MTQPECPNGFKFAEDFDEDEKCNECANENEPLYAQCGDAWEDLNRTE